MICNIQTQVWDSLQSQGHLRQPRSQGPLSTSRKYPGYTAKVTAGHVSTVYACQLKPHRGWVLNLSLSTLSREVNVALLQTLIF